MTVRTLRQVIAANRAGDVSAQPSICSAHPDVLRAVMLMPEARRRSLLIEATSNQVNQDGGYTGMQATDFVAFLHGLADETEFPKDQLILGGDHLGPQAWKGLPADQALAKAHTLVASYVEAGFTKIHLDCSEGTAGEPPHLDDDTVAKRAAALARTCEDHAPDPDRLAYIVGTEVPVPGGAHSDHEGIHPTSPESARQTMTIHRQTFDAGARERIVGLVVQPGVEFGAEAVDHLPVEDTTRLRPVLDDFPGLTFEAHSTDYQKPDAYPRLAKMGFAIHKVGPALTFAYRQAIYALDLMCATLTGQGPRVAGALEAAMMEDPTSWQGHYAGSESQQKLLRHFGYSDRVRYYWPKASVQSAVASLFADLEGKVPPEPMLLQYFTPDCLHRAADIPAGRSLAERLVLGNIQAALAPYYFEGAA